MPARAAIIFQQAAKQGYWLNNPFGYGYFCDSVSGCAQVTRYNMSAGILTNFNGLYAFAVPEGRVIGSVKLSLARDGAIADPGRLILWCDDPSNATDIKSSQSLKAADLDTEVFKTFQFDFPDVNCRALRGLRFDGLGGGWYGIKIESAKGNILANYGMGHIQYAGESGTGYEDYEPYIEIADKEPYIKPKQQICDLGYATPEYAAAGIPLPTYDYDPADGLVRFHFKGLSGYGAPFTYRRYDDYCNLVYPISWSSKGELFYRDLPTQNVMFKAKEVKDSSGNFLYYTWEAHNDDTGEFLPFDNQYINLAFADPIISVGFFSYIGYPGSVQYFENAIFSPAVLAKDPNFQSVKPKTPVLIVPGVLGTDILKEGEILWANPKMAYSSDDFMDPLSFSRDLKPVDINLDMGQVIREKQLGIFHSDYSKGLINQLTLSDFGYIEGKDLFTFPYDWRYGVNGKFDDGSTVVDQLKGQIDYILNQTDAGRAVGKVDIIAHSTGGLLIKEYVLEHPSDHHINKAVFVGVPNLGAPKAFKTLINGDNFDIPGLNAEEMKKIGQNMPVVYDLAPTQEYYNQAGSFFKIINPFAPSGDVIKELNYTEALLSMQADGLINTAAMGNSQSLHSQEFDNFDLRSKGIDLYSIVGCKSGTFGNFAKYINKDSAPTFDFPKITNGDGTVPFVSADSLAVDANKTYFVPKISHSSLLSADGARQQIASLIIGTQLGTGGKVLTRSEVINNPGLCKIKGEQIKIKSPVNITVTDQFGNISGLAEDGSVQNRIPGAEYEIWGDHKYVFLPTDDGQIYKVELNGYGDGTFTLVDESIEGDAAVRSQVFSNLPVTTSLIGNLNLGESDVLNLDMEGDGTFEKIINPSAVLSAEDALDLIPPVSTSTITVAEGQSGYYRSSVSVVLIAQDPVILGKETETSGVLGIKYKINNGEYADYNEPITISEEGAYTIAFYAVDKTGNNEEIKTLAFTIDKTPPEINVVYDMTTRDFVYTASDNLTANPQINCSINQCSATDEANNITVLSFARPRTSGSYSLVLKNVKYNISETVFPENIFTLVHAENKGQLKHFRQAGLIKKQQILAANYNPNANKTTIVDNQKGQLPKVYAQEGIKFLQVSTNKGTIKINIK